MRVAEALLGSIMDIFLSLEFEWIDARNMVCAQASARGRLYPKKVIESHSDMSEAAFTQTGDRFLLNRDFS